MSTVGFLAAHTLGMFHLANVYLKINKEKILVKELLHTIIV